MASQEDGREQRAAGRDGQQPVAAGPQLAIPPSETPGQAHRRLMREALGDVTVPCDEPKLFARATDPLGRRWNLSFDPDTRRVLLSGPFAA